MGQKRITDAQIEPVSVDDAAHHLRVMHNQDAGEIALMIKAARQAAERWTRRAFITQAWQLTLDAFPCGKLCLPRPELLEVDSVEYIDGDGGSQTLAEEAYRVVTGSCPGLIEPAYGLVWPTARCVSDAVTITYTAGYGPAAADVPADIRQAIKLMVGHYYNNRESVVTGTIAAELPQSAMWLLEGYRVKEFV